MAKDDEVIDYYLNEIKKIPLLTPSEELELAKKAKNGDISAKEKIVKSNLRFVITIAKKYIRNNYNYNFSNNVSVRVFKIISKDECIISCFRKDGSDFYLKINRKNDTIQHSGSYDKNKGINKISNLK